MRGAIKASEAARWTQREEQKNKKQKDLKKNQKDLKNKNLSSLITGDHHRSNTWT
jgi:hypothetical protein